MEFEEVYKNYNKIIHYLLNHYHITYNYDEFYQLLLIKMWQLTLNYDELDVIRDRSDFVMINNFTNEMKYRDGEIEGTIDLNQYYYKNRSQAASFIMMEYKKS